jgi:hypothetical protein
MLELPGVAGGGTWGRSSAEHDNGSDSAVKGRIAAGEGRHVRHIKKIIVKPYAKNRTYGLKGGSWKRAGVKRWYRAIIAVRADLQSQTVENLEIAQHLTSL